MLADPSQAWNGKDFISTIAKKLPMPVRFSSEPRRHNGAYSYQTKAATNGLQGFGMPEAGALKVRGEESNSSTLRVSGPDPDAFLCAAGESHVHNGDDGVVSLA